MEVSTRSSTPLKIHLLGQFAVFVYGELLPEAAISGRKARSLLKLLALQRHGRMIRDQATDALWPELDASAAASQLYKALHYLRKAFASRADEAGEWIEMTDELIRLVPPGGLVTDVRTFEETARRGLRGGALDELEQAMAVYAGDLLPMDLYADWATFPREHYRQLYLDVLTALASRYEQRGELSEAAEVLRLALEKEPALEVAHRGLMRIFARRGQVTRALRQYDWCEAVLERELEMEPSPETRKTLSDIRTRRFLAEPGASSPLSITRSMPPLIGRKAECDTIDRLVEQLSAGAGGVLVIQGSVGLGKTRLAQEVEARSRRLRLPVFTGHAREQEERMAYGLIVDLLQPILHAHPALEELLPEEFGRLIPSFAGDGAPIPHADRLAARGYLFAQVQRLFARLAEEESPVLILEDLHAADEGSRRLLFYLLRHTAELPILWAVTTRAEAGALLEVERERPVARLELEPLPAKEHASLLQQRSPGFEEAAEGRIYRLSEGNPLFALELLRFQEEEGSDASLAEASHKGNYAPGQLPSSLRYVVEQRLKGLSPAAHHLLYIAAVIGRRVPYEVIAAVWDGGASSEESLFDALEEVTRGRLLEERGLDYSFRHTLVREVIYASISEARRRALHARVARRLIGLAGSPEEEPVEQIAHHLVRAGEDWQGVHYLMRAAERAEEAYAHEEALERYGEALSVLEELDEVRARRLRREVLERIGDVYRTCGRLEKSSKVYEEAVALAEEVPLSGSHMAELHRKLALVAIFRTEMDRSEKHLARAFELVEERTPAHGRLLIIQALHLWHLNRLEEAYEQAQEALELAEAVGAKAEASQACELLAMACLPLGRWEEGLDYEMRRQVYGWSPEIVVATDAHLCLWEYHIGGDRPFEQAQAFMQGVAEQAAELGDLRCVAVCHYALGTMHLWRGHSQKAADELDASLKLHERVGSPAGMAYALARKGVLHTLQGAIELGWQAVRNGFVHAQQAAVRDHCLQRLYGVGLWNRLEAGDMTRARRLVEKSAELLEEAGACGACALELYPWLAYFYLRSGEVDHARTCGEAVSELAAATGNPIGEALAAIIESSHCMIEQDGERAEHLRRKAFRRAEAAVNEVTHSPVVYFLDRMVDQQEKLVSA